MTLRRCSTPRRGARLGPTLAVLVVVTAACAGGSDAATRPQTTAPGVAATLLSRAPGSATSATERPTTTTAVRVPVTPAAPPSTTAAPVATVAATTTPSTTTPSTTTPATTTPATNAPNTTTSAAPTSEVGTSASRPPVLGPRTSCRQVVHIGDSTSEHLWDASTVGGDPAATMEARYRAVGVEDVHNDTSGGRSMIERINRGQRNAIEVAEEIRASGYRGCWVLMIGTNDAANVAAGANTGPHDRIESMLAVIGEDPVLWVNTSSSSTIPFYGGDSMRSFNVALADAVARHPNLWVLDWAAVVQPDWYGPDGLHYGSTGRAWRTALTAQELAWAFPA